ncbi:L-fuculose-phosphate aldolase [Bacillus timonensis]|nr:L-fuculose-phosphate aldolase [Bacillus timonensis]
MLLENERKDIVHYCQLLIKQGLTKGTGGNISVYNRSEGLMAISPSGIDYFEMKPEDVVVLDLNGNVIDGNRKPSSELDMHTIFYRERKDLNAIVHTHSVFCKTISSLRWEIPAVSYLVAFSGGENVRCSEYATFGTMELAKFAFEAMKDRRAVLLANHGLLTGAHDLANAFNIAEEIELCAEVFYRAKSIGEPVILPKEEMNDMLKKFKSYGQK